MSAEENKETLRRYHVEELWNKGDLAVADKIISPDYVYHGGPMGDFRGPEGVKRLVATARSVFPDIHYSIDDMVAEGDKVAVRYTMTGTFKGEFMGTAPTGKQVKTSEAIFYRFADGKEIEALDYNDHLVLCQQMGINPPGQ